MSDKKQTLDFQNTQIAFEYRTNKALRKAARLFSLMGNKWLVDAGSGIGLKMIEWNVPFVRKVVKNTVFEHFCGGANFEETQQSINELYEYKVQTILDYGVEAKQEENELDATMSEIIKAINFGATNESVPVVVSKVSGLARFALLEKIQRGEALSDTEKEEWDNAKHRVNTICHHAQEKEVSVFFDAEETWVQDTIDGLVDEMMKKYNKSKVYVYNTFQMYRKDRLAFLKKSHQKALSEGYLIGAKLVRGAYMDKERARAAEMGYDSPIQDTKENTDKDYNAALTYCIENYTTIATCNASHNEFSNYYLVELIEKFDIPKNHPHVNFCQLYGMGDHISFNLAKHGFSVAKYVPYGLLKDVVPYLIRRAQENSSVTGEVGRELKLIQKEMKRRKM